MSSFLGDPSRFRFLRSSIESSISFLAGIDTSPVFINSSLAFFVAFAALNALPNTSITPPNARPSIPFLILLTNSP